MPWSAFLTLSRHAAGSCPKGDGYSSVGLLLSAFTELRAFF